VYGSSGSGKTTFLKHASTSLSKSNYLFALNQSCQDLQGLTLSKLDKFLSGLIPKLVWQAPSLLTLDDIDLLMPIDTDRTDPHVARDISIVFCSFLNSLLSNNIHVIATASSKSSMNRYIQDQKVFLEFVSITAPTLSERLDILRDKLQASSYPCHADFDNWASKLDGCNRSDLSKFYSQAVHIGKMRSRKCNIQMELLNEDFENSIQRLKIVNSNRSDGFIEWDSIGGMHKPKQILLKTIEWPTLFPKLFKNLPIRLQSGVLLYGYPGCGKTLLAQAIAQRCKMNFFSVKGPELLNKYIGASEKGVRDLFEKARAAAPCCLLFDEFDSIAQCRGSDNAGVTDRMVNQLLTEMDGAEGLTGVFVIATTNRPHMIDPALLRPGRLDKLIFCDLPSGQERIEIIKTISEKMKLSHEVDIESIAQRTAGFTGADLRGLMYNSHLQSINQGVENIAEPPIITGKAIVISGNHHMDLSPFLSSKTPEMKSKAMQITPQHITEALQNFQSSLSAKDKQKLRKQFDDFAHGRRTESIGTKSSLF
jgi:peroxin-1